MADRAIPFTGPMIRALLAGTKTQTRRLMPHQDALAVAYSPKVSGGRILNYACEEEISRPRYSVGDRLWVREAWRTLQKLDALKPSHLADDRSIVTYEADPERRNPLWAFGRYRPGMFMPRWASRLTLTVTDVRIERLNSITEEDALAEGVVPRTPGLDYWVPGVEHENPDFPYLSRPTAREMYAALWDTINGSGAWGTNPWVVAYTFTVAHRNIDEAKPCS